MSEAVLALERAGRDPRVAGLVVRLDGEGQGWAVAQELREAVLAFRADGRFAYAWSDSLGELSPANEGYMLAAAFDRITLQPGGFVGLAGLGIEQPFARGLLDRLGIEPEVVRRSGYKTALDNFTERDLTPTNAEMLNDVADSLFGQLVAAVAEGRKLPQERVRALIDDGPYLAETALDKGLIDGLGYEDETLDAALSQAGGEAKPVGLDGYAKAKGTDDDGAPRVALVQAAGMVTRGSALPGEAIAADDMAELLRSLRKDKDVRAVVLRLDTPGGSAVASETIGREVRALVAAGRPVVVSMGNAAASGGYWISMGASRIVAQPGTLTGSIGVIAGKPVVGEALAKLDVNVAEIDRGQHADIWSLAKPYDPRRPGEGRGDRRRALRTLQGRGGEGPGPRPRRGRAHRPGARLDGRAGAALASRRPSGRAAGRSGGDEGPARRTRRRRPRRAPLPGVEQPGRGVARLGPGRRRAVRLRRPNRGGAGDGAQGRARRPLTRPAHPVGASPRRAGPACGRGHSLPPARCAAGRPRRRR